MEKIKNDALKSNIKRKQYLEANKDSIKQQQKQYREANKDSIKQYQKKYREANKELRK